MARGFKLLLLPLALLLAVPTLGRSATLDRAEYVQRVEAICKAETEAHGSVLTGVEAMVRRGELKRAAPRVRAAAAALRSAAKRVAAVPRPEADAARLARWLGFAQSGNALLTELAGDLQRGDRDRVQGLANELLRETKRANATVVGFEFEYCRVSPARFV